jgi:hypothetical protein
MKRIKSYWIKERHNPQFDKPYYSACGQLSKREAMKKEYPRYGSNNMLEYKTLDEYNQALEHFKAGGFIVHNL